MSVAEVADKDIRNKSESSGWWAILLCTLAAVAYLPALNNGFIADDYPILARIEVLKTDPLYLFRIAPENFRLISYLIFAIVKAIVGYHAAFFYTVNIALHAVNVVLLARLLRLLTNDEFIARVAALFFAVFQAPQEAVLWLAAMNETTLGFFAMMTLLMWWRKRWLWAAACYTLALFSKESALVILILIPLLDLYEKRDLFNPAYLLLLVPSAAFAAIFLYTAPINFMLRSHSYEFSLHAVLVLAKTLHRLVWPWLYVIALLLWIQHRALPRLRLLTAYLACVVVTMLPYMFIAYQTSLPSRQLYLASAVLMAVFATLLKPLQGTRVLAVFIVAFVGFNIGYLWIRKDKQFEDRAAPTTQLVEAMRNHSPQRTLILNFAYRYPEIARAAALAVPGWAPEMIFVDEPVERCSDCWRLRWDAQTHRYE